MREGSGGGCARLKRLMADPQAAAGSMMSELERRLFRLLKASNLPLPVTQFRVDLDSGPRFLDFAYPDRMVAIETDGYVWHGGRSRWKKDLARSNQLISQGWRVAHVTWDDLAQNPQEVIRLIRSLIG